MFPNLSESKAISDLARLIDIKCILIFSLPSGNFDLLASPRSVDIANSFPSGTTGQLGAGRTLGDYWLERF